MMKRILLLLLTGVLIPSVFAQSAGKKLDQLLTAYVNKNEFQGSVLVARKGEILLQKGYGNGNNENSIYQIASVTKTFTKPATEVLPLITMGAQGPGRRSINAP